MRGLAVRADPRITAPDPGIGRLPAVAYSPSCL